jgi:hypothetical protein
LCFYSGIFYYFFSIADSAFISNLKKDVDKAKRTQSAARAVERRKRNAVVRADFKLKRAKLDKMAVTHRQLASQLTKLRAAINKQRALVLKAQVQKKGIFVCQVCFCCCFFLSKSCDRLHLQCIIDF